MSFLSRLLSGSQSQLPTRIPFHSSSSNEPDAKLTTWAGTNGVRSVGGIEARDGLRGLYLDSNPSSRVRKGTPLVTVPYELALTQERASEVCSTSSSVSPISELPEWSSIAVMLLEARYNANRNERVAKWSPYVQSLPSFCGCLLELSEAERALFLRHSTARTKAQRILDGYRESVEQLQPLLTAYMPQLTERDFQWCYSMLLSRLIRLEARGGVQAMVPWMDLINHSASASGSFINTLDSDPSIIAVTASRDYAPGEQLYASYGDGKSSAEFLMSYGFVPSDLEMDSEVAYVSLSLDPTDPQLDLKARLLARADLPPNGAVFPLRLGALPLGLLGFAALSISRIGSEDEGIPLLSETSLSPELRAKAQRVVLAAVKEAYKGLGFASIEDATNAATAAAAGNKGVKKGKKGQGEEVNAQLEQQIYGLAGREMKILSRWQYLLGLPTGR